MLDGVGEGEGLGVVVGLGVGVELLPQFLVVNVLELLSIPLPVPSLE